MCVCISIACFRSNFFIFLFTFCIVWGSDRGFSREIPLILLCCIFCSVRWISGYRERGMGEKTVKMRIRKRMFVVFLVSLLVFVFLCVFCFVYGYLHFNTPFASTTSASSIQLVNNFKKHILLNTFIIHVICVSVECMCMSRGMWIANNMFNSFFSASSDFSRHKIRGFIARRYVVDVVVHFCIVWVSLFFSSSLNCEYLWVQRFFLLVLFSFPFFPFVFNVLILVDVVVIFCGN